MKAKFSKRLIAFIIDVIIVTLLFTGINLIIPKNRNIEILESELTELRSEYLKQNIDTSIYINRYASIQKSLDQQNIPINILNVIFIVGYFAFLPHYWDGRTVGKRLLKIKVIKNNPKERVSLNDYLLRTIIITGVALFLISTCFVFLVSEFNYFLIITICGIIQFLLVIFSVFMVIYRHDKSGVHDLISGTQVIEER